MTISNTSSGLRPGVVTYATRPTNPYNGQVIYETDTGRTQVWNGSGWVVIANTTGGGSNVRLAYQTRTSSYAVSQTSLSSASDIFSTDLTWTADGTSTYWIEFYVPYIYTSYSGTDNYITCYLVDGSGNDLGRIATSPQNNVSGQRSYGCLFIKTPYTPASGSRSINIRAVYNGGDTSASLVGGSGTGGYVAMWCSVSGPSLT